MKAVKNFFQEDRRYFLSHQEDINRQNYGVLRIACMIYAGILTLFTFLNVLMGESDLLILMYFIYDVIHFALCFWVFNKSISASYGGKHLHAMRIVFEVSVLSFFALEAVLPYPNEQSIYFPFPILLLVIVFINTPMRVLFKTTSYIVAFSAMTFLVKSNDVWVNETYIAIGTFITALTGYVITAGIRHESARYIEELHILSTTDPLTGLNNKKTFENLCNAYFSLDLTKRNYAMLFTDIDKFKQINDKHGHPFGDTVLKRIAEIISDVFSSDAYYCRYGGDEFVILMKDVESKKKIQDEVQRFQNAVTQLAGKLGLDSLSCSVGVAVKADGRVRYSEILSRSDSALYIAKKQHLGCVMIDSNGQSDEDNIVNKNTD